MLKRIVEISQSRTYLSVRLGQLVVRHAETAGKPGIRGESVSQIPCEDFGLLLVDHAGTTYTHSVLTTLLECGAGVVFCGEDHHPVGMLLPVVGNSVQTARMRAQVGAKEPLKKQLWRQLMVAKIGHQAKVLGPDSAAYESLQGLARRVRSGDPENVEAQASRKYWPAFLADLEFRRRVSGMAPNNLLNYGYMVVRAAVARALCGPRG